MSCFLVMELNIEDLTSPSANRTLVPVHCRVGRDLSDFDGSWTVRGQCLHFVVASADSCSPVMGE